MEIFPRSGLTERRAFFTNRKYATSKYVALDCEMVGIGSQGRKSAWVLLDTHVQVPVMVTDSRTYVLDVKPKHIDSRSSNAMEVSKMPRNSC